MHGIFLHIFASLAILFYAFRLQLMRLYPYSIIIMYILAIKPVTSFAVPAFGEHYCTQKGYACFTVSRGDTWEKLFPVDDVRDLIMRINRRNVQLKPGMRIAIPRSLDTLNIYDIAPFPRYIQKGLEKTIYISQKNLAWGAYDTDGTLLWWGPISPGIGNCSETDGCNTPVGSFRIYDKGDAECISSVFPRREDGENGGAPMPYCMYYFKGYALHGSYSVPGYPASHGCIRLFIEDARWLNQEFVTLPTLNQSGTRLIVGEP